MKKTNKFLKSQFTFLILLSILLYSCADKISKEEYKELLKVTKSEKIDYSFNSDGIEIIVYNSHIIEKKKKSTYISSFFYNTVVMREKRVMAMNNFVKLIFKDGNNSIIFKTKYKDLIILRNLERYLYEIVNTNSLDKKYYVEKGIILKKIDSVFRNYTEIRISRYKIDDFYNIFIEKKAHHKVTEYQFKFRKKTPYKLFSFNEIPATTHQAKPQQKGSKVGTLR